MNNFKIIGWLLFRQSAWRDYVAGIRPALPPDFTLLNLTRHHWHSPEIRWLGLLLLLQPLAISVGVGGILVISQLFMPIAAGEILSSVGYSALGCLSFSLLGSFIVSVAFALIASLLGSLSIGLWFGLIISDSFSLGIFLLLFGVAVALILGVMNILGIQLYLMRHERIFKRIKHISGTVLLSLFILILAYFIIEGLRSSLEQCLGKNGLEKCFKTFEDRGTLLIIAVTLSMAGLILAQLQTTRHQRTLQRQIGGIIIGISISLLVFSIAYYFGVHIFPQLFDSVAKYFVKYFPQLSQSTVFEIIKSNKSTIGMSIAVGFMLGSFLKSWRSALTLAIIFGLIITLLLFLKAQVSPQKNFLAGVIGGTINGIILSILFAFPFLVARQVASVWSGIIAGILNSSGFYFSFAFKDTFFSKETFFWLLAILLCLGAGLNYQRLTAYLVYPFEMAWNTVLLQRQKRHPEQGATLLRKNSAFWHENQHLPLHGLEIQLVLLHEQDSESAQAAMHQLGNSLQGWAVQAAQIELDVRQLARCQTIQEIAKVRKILKVSETWKEPEKRWLFGFRECSQRVAEALKQQQFADFQAIAFQFLGGLLTGIPNTDDNALIDVQQLGEIGKKWQDIIKQHALELQEVVEIPNPYIPMNPLDKNAHVFVGRADISKRIETLLLATQCPPLLLYGQRRAGKTSLLKNLGRILPDEILLFFVDCQGPLAAVRGELGFFYNLGRAIHRAAAEYPGLTIPPLTEESLEKEPSTRFDEWLDEIEQITVGKTLLLVLDEFVVLDEAFHEGRLNLKAILGMFRHIIQHRPHFRLLFSGTHTLEELQHWASYFINVQPVHLSYLTANEARQLIENPIENFPLRYTPESSDRVFTLTRGQPALVQLMCREIVLFKNNQKTPNERVLVKLADVEKTIIPITLEKGNFFFADIAQNQVSPLGKKVLCFMAAYGERAVISRKDLQERFSEDLTEILAWLLRRELIEESENGYGFQVELTRRWFAAIK